MKKITEVLFLFILCSLLFFGIFLVYVKNDNEERAKYRGHGDVEVEVIHFQESNKQLYNPNRGFYYMRGFRINEEEKDYRKDVSDVFYWDDQTNIAMVQFNLEHYKDGEISEDGLDNLETILAAMKKTNKQFVIRFLYDWDGENEKYEPESLDIILHHMEQIGPILTEYQDMIFVIQGLFIGNWGEMNGTKYANSEDIKILAEKLAEVTASNIYLSVRMPMHWRMATGIADIDMLQRKDVSLATRLGLYNDGMLGSWSDYGTYGDQTREEHGDFTFWNRQEELAFQEELCKFTPNGGETIFDNPYNDLPNALEDLKQMHVTYLNKDFDKNVLDKWKETTITEDGCFQGMDGLSYIERHLGYRLLIQSLDMTYSFEKDIVKLDVGIINVGFAPIYKEAETRLILYQENTGEMLSYKAEKDIRNLCGGNETENIMELSWDISMAGKEPQKYTVYLDIRDIATGQRIYLGNDAEPEEYGYRLGTIALTPIDEQLYYGDNVYYKKLFNAMQKFSK